MTVDLGQARTSSLGKARYRTTRGATMKYLMLVCWDAENMDAQTEPDRPILRTRRVSPGSTTSRRGAAGSPATNWLRRAGHAPSASATGKRSSPTVRSPRPRRRSAASTSSSATAWRRPSRSLPDTLSPGRGRSRSDRSGGTDHPRPTGPPFARETLGRVERAQPRRLRDRASEREDQS